MHEYGNCTFRYINGDRFLVGSANRINVPFGNGRNDNNSFSGKRNQIYMWVELQASVIIFQTVYC